MVLKRSDIKSHFALIRYGSEGAYVVANAKAQITSFDGFESLTCNKVSLLVPESRLASLKLFVSLVGWQVLLGRTS